MGAGERVDGGTLSFRRNMLEDLYFSGEVRGAADTTAQGGETPRGDSSREREAMVDDSGVMT